MRHSGTLKLCAMRIRLRGTESTPLNVAIAVGKNTLSAIVATFEPSPMPSQSISSGSSAIFAIRKKRRNERQASGTRHREQADRETEAVPNTVPRNQP